MEIALMFSLGPTRWDGVDRFWGAPVWKQIIKNALPRQMPEQLRPKWDPEIELLVVLSVFNFSELSWASHLVHM